MLPPHSRMVLRVRYPKGHCLQFSIAYIPASDVTLRARLREARHARHFRFMSVIYPPVSPRSDDSLHVASVFACRPAKACDLKTCWCSAKACNRSVGQSTAAMLFIRVMHLLPPRRSTCQCQWPPHSQRTISLLPFPPLSLRVCTLQVAFKCRADHDPSSVGTLNRRFSESLTFPRFCILRRLPVYVFR